MEHLRDEVADAVPGEHAADLQGVVEALQLLVGEVLGEGGLPVVASVDGLDGLAREHRDVGPLLSERLVDLGIERLVERPVAHAPVGPKRCDGRVRRAPLDAVRRAGSVAEVREVQLQICNLLVHKRLRSMGKVTSWG